MRYAYDRASGRVFGKPDPDKAAIARFFEASEYDIFAAGYVIDKVTGEWTDIPLAATGRDGFCWDSDDAYHFGKYDMELTPEFRTYALAHEPGE